VAITRTDLDNGCMQMLKGSHFMGKVPTEMIGDGLYADREVIKEALATYEVVDVILDPGDVVFFHAQTLHASRGSRVKDKTRRILLHCALNAASNAEFVTHKSHRYQPMARAQDDILLNRGYTSVADDIRFLKYEKGGDWWGQDQADTP